MSSLLECTVISVGIDTARYGHHVTFLRDDLQPALAACDIPECRAGYERLQGKFQQLAGPAGNVHFRIRLDAAGQYATNLETFLRQLPFPNSVSVGEPKRNRRYREAIFPKRKADAVESYCAARFAAREAPPETLPLAPALYHLRELASRLAGQARQSTRLTNQLHNVLARVFPELATIVSNLQSGWLLRLLDRYPTPAQLARVRKFAIPHAKKEQLERLQAAARSTVGSLTGPTAQHLVRSLVRQLRLSRNCEKDLEGLLIAAYQDLPQPNHIVSIPGIGAATAAVLTAKIVDINRFRTPNQLVSFFGVFPEEDASGVDADGQPKPGRQQHMSRQGNDLVRKYLWMAAKSAIVHNPAVRALYRRLRSRGKRGDVALGHCMRKLLHLVFAIWHSGKPFAPDHYPWDQAPSNDKAAGHKQGTSPEERKVVTAADSSVKPPLSPVKMEATPQSPTSEPCTRTTARVDFASLRQQLTMERVLEHLGYLPELKGSGPQRRGPCPLHNKPGERGHCFSVNLHKNIFRCFHPPCGKQGNVLDFWAAFQGLPLREAAQHLLHTFDLETSSRNREEEPVRNP